MFLKIKKILKIPEIWIFLFFIIISAFFYPSILHPNTYISGAGGGDDFGKIYEMWWFNYSKINNLDFNFQSLVNFPYSVGPFQNLHPFLNSIIFHGLLPFLNEIATYNLINWISFPLSAIGMYFLVFHITKNRLAGFLSGIIYTFLPYHFLRAQGHLPYTHIEWFPLYLLFLLKFTEKKSYKNAIYAGIFFALNVLTDPLYAIFATILTILFFSVRFFTKKNKLNIEKIKSFLVFGIVILLIVLPFYLPPYLKQFKNISNFASPRPIQELYNWGQQSIKFFFIPWQDNYLFGDTWNKIFYHGKEFPDIERMAYLGIPAILLAIYAIYKWRKEKLKNQKFNFVMILLIVIAVTAAIFSFSPPISPSLWIYKIFPQFRVYARFSILVGLATTVLAGIGLKYLFESLKTSKSLKYIPIKRLTAYVFTLVFIIIILDFLPSFKTTNVSEPPEEYVWLRNQPKDTVIVEYPFVSSSYSPAPTYVFWQRIHQQPIINGQYEPDLTGKEQIRLQVLDITNPKITTILKKIGAKYLFLHKDQYNKPYYEGAPMMPDKILNKNINPKNINPNLEFIQRFGQTYVYKIK